MTRRILCRACGEGWQLHPDDRAMGIEGRRVPIRIGPVPAGHSIKVYTDGKLVQEERLKDIHCDSCNQVIPPGNLARCITTWNTQREGIPRNWEECYGVLV